MMPSGTIDRLARRAHRGKAIHVARGLIPEDADPRALVDNVARHRRRPIRLLPVPLPPDAPSGMWVAVDDTDYLVYPAGTSPTRETAVICHEVGHMLLGHDPGLRADDNRDLLAALAPDLAPALAARMLTRHGYASSQEADAEYVGTVLATLIARGKDGAAWTRQPGSMSAHLR